MVVGKKREVELQDLRNPKIPDGHRESADRQKSKIFDRTQECENRVFLMYRGTVGVLRLREFSYPMLDSRECSRTRKSRGFLTW